MLTKEDVRQNAWIKQQAAKALFDKKLWADAVHNCGYAVELILKARICVDHNLTGFPENNAEFKIAKAAGLDLKTHDLEKLLNMTSLAAHVKQDALKEWSICLKWSPEGRYHMDKENETSAAELIRSAVEILKRITDVSGLEGYDAAEIAASDNPYAKLVPIEQQLSDEHGDFALFAICHRHDSFPASSDVVVAADWIDAESGSGLEHVTDTVPILL